LILFVGETVGVDQHVIEKNDEQCEQNRMQRIYQQHDYAAEQRNAWAKLGTLLEQLTA
jgi:hypothetical protein